MSTSQGRGQRGGPAKHPHPFTIHCLPGNPCRGTHGISLSIHPAGESARVGCGGKNLISSWRLYGHRTRALCGTRGTDCRIVGHSPRRGLAADLCLLAVIRDQTPAVNAYGTRLTSDVHACIVLLTAGARAPTCCGHRAGIASRDGAVPTAATGCGWCGAPYTGKRWLGSVDGRFICCATRARTGNDSSAIFGGDASREKRT
jgi:hypothetical protein